jgi:hypothetical protein
MFGKSVRAHKVSSTTAGGIRGRLLLAAAVMALTLAIATPAFAVNVDWSNGTAFTMPAGGFNAMVAAGTIKNGDILVVLNPESIDKVAAMSLSSFLTDFNNTVMWIGRTIGHAGVFSDDKYNANKASCTSLYGLYNPCILSAGVDSGLAWQSMNDFVGSDTLFILRPRIIGSTGTYRYITSAEADKAIARVTASNTVGYEDKKGGVAVAGEQYELQVTVKSAPLWIPTWAIWSNKIWSAAHDTTDDTRVRYEDLLLHIRYVTWVPKTGDKGLSSAYLSGDKLSAASGTWYCSKAVWFAYYNGLGVDYDFDGGSMVWPADLVRSAYKPVTAGGVTTTKLGLIKLLD